MKKMIPEILFSNCSEAVFRFHTVKPDEIQKILQLIANEISANEEYEGFKNQIVPLFEKAEMYDTNWNGELTYSGEIRKKYDDEINENWDKRNKGLITQEQAMEIYGEIQKRMRYEIYPNSILKACAGLGDNDAVIKVNKEKGFFTLNIGNNDIIDNTTNWIESIKEMNIQT